MDQQFNTNINELVKAEFHAALGSIKDIGGGFYGRVFLVEMDAPPYRLVIKVYNRTGLNTREQAQLTTLGEYSTLPMPRVYFVHHKSDKVPLDVLGMEYIEGINAGEIYDMPEENRKRIADQIIDNLIAYHSVIHPEGFGELNSGTYTKDWNEYYKPKVDLIFEKATKMHKNKQLDNEVYETVKSAYENYGKIFGEKVEHARLIHGDYNMWNVMLEQDRSAAAAVIDPFNCCWADAELDLYQLSNANGKYFGLLDNYRSKIPLSRNFEIKNSFYELFTEIMHFYDANVDVSHSNIKEEAKQLRMQMKKLLE
ncbi:phosphotransferase [Paenibacillus sp. BAC0078]